MLCKCITNFVITHSFGNERWWLRKVWMRLKFMCRCGWPKVFSDQYPEFAIISVFTYIKLSSVPHAWKYIDAYGIDKNLDLQQESMNRIHCDMWKRYAWERIFSQYKRYSSSFILFHTCQHEYGSSPITYLLTVYSLIIVENTFLCNLEKKIFFKFIH